MVDSKCADSKRIAGLIGPTLMVLNISEALNLHIWETNIPPITYLNGLLFFIAGLAIVRAHNRWEPSWVTLVTFAGWAAMVLGCFRMFAPEAQQAGESLGTYIGIFLIFLVGTYLTFKAYVPVGRDGVS
jgi:hypothetical protein